MDPKLHLLILEAQKRMGLSRDPVHDMSHAERVAQFALRLAKDTKLTTEQTYAVVLAAWWHDVGRTITKNPSFIWMPFFDDLLSAFMLWGATIRAGLFGTIAGVATRIIFCKSLGTGAILTRLLMRRHNRILIDVLKDADSLDILTHERIAKLLPFVEKSRRYYWGYKTLIRWFVSTKQLQMKTQAARTYVIQLLKNFLTWATQVAVYAWHVAQFGQAWCDAMLKRGERLLRHIEYLYILDSRGA